MEFGFLGEDLVNLARQVDRQPHREKAGGDGNDVVR